MNVLSRFLLVTICLLSTVVVSEAAIDPWLSGTNYPLSSVVRGSDNNNYRAVVAAPTDNPVTDSGSNWVLEDVYVPTTLTVSSGGQFTTLTTAYNFVASAKIAHGITVTISIAAGYTSMEPAPVVIDTSQGARLQVIGGTGSTLNFTTNATNKSGLVINSGCTLSLLTGVSIVGPIINSPATYTLYNGTQGITVMGGGSLVIRTISMTGFDASVSVAGFLAGSPTGGLTVTNAGDEGVVAEYNGFVYAPYTVVNGVGNYAPGGLGFGIAAGQSGSVYCPFSSVTNAANVSYYANGGSEMYAYEVTSAGSPNFVYYPTVNTVGNYGAIVWNTYVLKGGPDLVPAPTPRSLRPIKPFEIQPTVLRQDLFTIPRSMDWGALRPTSFEYLLHWLRSGPIVG